MYIEPGYEVVQLRLRTVPDGAELLDLDLRGVRAVGVDRIHGRELLRLDFPDGSPASTLWLRMKPDVALLPSYGVTTSGPGRCSTRSKGMRSLTAMPGYGALTRSESATRW